VETDGTVVVATGLTTQGQGHQTAFAQVVAEELGVPIERVVVTTGDTRRFKYAVGTFASRAAVMSGNAVALAARKVREKALRVAGEALEADPRDLEIVDGVVQVKGTPGAEIPLSTVAVLSNPLRYAFDEQAKRATQFSTPADPDKPPVAEDDEPGLEGTDYYSPVHSTFASGMHAVVPAQPATGDFEYLGSYTKPSDIPYLNVFCDPQAFQCNSPTTLDYIRAERNTVGVSSNIIEASWQALMESFSYYLLHHQNNTNQNGKYHEKTDKDFRHYA
jgi:hypothetical protein